MPRNDLRALMPRAWASMCRTAFPTSHETHVSPEGETRTIMKGNDRLTPKAQRAPALVETYAPPSSV